MPMTDTSNRFLRLNAVLEKTGLSRATLYRKIEEGTFPKQITIGARCVAWLESDIEEWMRKPMCYSADDQAQAEDLLTANPTVG
jgi:prophage regulatory protein